MAWDDDLDISSPAYRLAASNEHTVRALAGPGSGKSFALMRRIGRLIESGEVQPNEILALTFTRTSAQDLQRDIERLGVRGSQEIDCGTVHSQALKILGRHEVFRATSRTARMAIDHEWDPALEDLKKPEYGDKKERRRKVASYLAAYATLQGMEVGYSPDPTNVDYENEFVNWLKRMEAVLVGEVIPLVVRFLESNPGDGFVKEYKVILVDEFQDLNKAEQRFIQLIRGDADLVIVGDDDQSIYSFKYAYPEGIRDIVPLFGDYQDVTFDVCRRCPKQIVRLASNLISKNSDRSLGDLIPVDSNEEGEVYILQWDSVEQEVNGIAKIIEKELQNQFIEPEDILVLSPRKLLGYQIRDELIKLGIPVKSYFKESTLKQKESRRFYSMLYLLYDESDMLSWRYLLGFGSADYRLRQFKIVSDKAHESGRDIRSILRDVLNGELVIHGVSNITKEFEKIDADVNKLLTGIMEDKLKEAVEEIFEVGDDWAEKEELFTLLQILQEELEVHMNGEADPEDEELVDLYRKAFRSFQERVALPDMPKEFDHVRIMSLHASKGLSSKVVIVSSMIRELMPFVKREGLEKEEIESKIEEQRRLFYVAMTRCKTTSEYPGKLIISSFVHERSWALKRLNIQVSGSGVVSLPATTFLEDFGSLKPASIRGKDYLSESS